MRKKKEKAFGFSPITYILSTLPEYVRDGVREKKKK
jgi:hypothetical protein